MGGMAAAAEQRWQTSKALTAVYLNLMSMVETKEVETKEVENGSWAFSTMAENVTRNSNFKGLNPTSGT